MAVKIDKKQMADNAKDAEAFLKCLANSNRLMILCALFDGASSRGSTVGELNEEVPLSQSALSQHLSVLREAGMVKTQRQSQTIYYSLADQRVKTLLPTLYKVFCQT